IAALLALIGLVSLVLDEVARVPWADAVGALVIAVIVAREGWPRCRRPARTSRSRPNSPSVRATGGSTERPWHTIEWPARGCPSAFGVRGFGWRDRGGWPASGRRWRSSWPSARAPRCRSAHRTTPPSPHPCSLRRRCRRRDRRPW